MPIIARLPAPNSLLRAVLFAMACVLAAGAQAQMQLPGAVTPSGEGTVTAPTAPKPRRTGPPPPPKVPSDETLLGRTLEYNGRSGLMQFTRDGKDLRLAHLTLPGTKISNAAEACMVEPPGAPFALAPQGRPHGVTNYSVTAGECTIAFDVLDGAVLVAAGANVCTFPANDCKVDPSGLWGQPASEIGVTRTKEIERQRTPAEQTMRANFRAWIEMAGKDRDLVRGISREQAGFSSSRSEVCDNYAREADHGYCALLLTQARSIALAAHITPAPEPPPEPDQGFARRKKR